MSTQIELTCKFIVGNFLWGTGQHDLPFRQQISSIRNGESLLYVVVSDQDSDISGFQFGYDSLDFFYSDGVNTCKRFIQENKVRVCGQCSGNLRSSTLTTRQEVTTILADAVQTELSQ